MRTPEVTSTTDDPEHSQTARIAQTVEIDLTIKDSWVPENGKKIAKKLGFEYTEAFEAYLKNFIDNDVKMASVTRFLELTFYNICTKHLEN